MQITGNPRKTKGFRDLGRVDIAALKAAVLAIPEEVWQQENANKPNRFEALDRTAHIVFRFVDNTRDWRNSHDRALWAEFAPLLEPVMQAATRAYGYQRGAFPRVMLARMPPGGVIMPHRDENRAAFWPHKIHLPLQTNSKVQFVLESGTRNLVEGEAVEVNNLDGHAVRNDGDTDRIHLIFEYYDLDQPEPDWLREGAAANA
jgi:hypothetical protein